jgi:hypothetical protein
MIPLPIPATPDAAKSRLQRSAKAGQLVPDIAAGVGHRQYNHDPAKPSSRPATLAGPARSSLVATRATITVKSGVVAFRIAARLPVVWPRASTKG